MSKRLMLAVAVPRQKRGSGMYQVWQLARGEGPSIEIEIDSNQLNRGQATLRKKKPCFRSPRGRSPRPLGAFGS